MGPITGLPVPMRVGDPNPQVGSEKRMEGNVYLRSTFPTAKWEGNRTMLRSKTYIEEFGLQGNSKMNRGRREARNKHPDRPHRQEGIGRPRGGPYAGNRKRRGLVFGGVRKVCQTRQLLVRGKTE